MKDKCSENQAGFKPGNRHSVRGASARWQKGLGLEYGEEDSNFNDDFHFSEISRKQPPKYDSRHCYFLSYLVLFFLYYGLTGGYDLGSNRILRR